DDEAARVGGAHRGLELGIGGMGQGIAGLGPVQRDQADVAALLVADLGVGHLLIMSAVRLVVYSDFLCPWCWNAATRLASVERSLGPAVAIEWKSYLLRPRPEPGRDLEKFRAYTQGWLRVAADEPRAPFVPWASDAGPPSHSLPAHVAAKAARSLGEEAGACM